MAENQNQNAAQENGKAKRGHPGDEVVASSKDAIALAEGRKSGPRQAFKLTLKDGTEVFRVSHNIYMAGFRQYLKDGNAIERIGAATRGPRSTGPATQESVLAALNSLSEKDRAEVLAAWGKQQGGAAPAKPAHTGGRK